MNQQQQKKRNQQQQFQFCDVCRLNHNQGRRHNYFPTHKTSLATLLARFNSKLSHVKSFLNTPTPNLPDLAQHQNCLWCIFCNCNIFEHNPFACGNAIQHLASVEHCKRIKAFMWKYGGVMDHVDLFRVTEADYVKWEKKCKTLKIEAAKAESIGPVSAPSKRIGGIRCSAQYQLFQMLVHQTIYLEVCKRNMHSTQKVDSGIRTSYGEYSSPGLVNLTRISCTSKEGMEGNVHSGAPPPWFDATNTNQLDDVLKTEEGVSKTRKSSKLNPKRVGAAWAERRKLELELERRGEPVKNHYDANWLPNFGGVWQSGPRKESRKEFQMESKASPKIEVQTEMAIPLQPYIGKRVRRETSEH